MTSRKRRPAVRRPAPQTSVVLCATPQKMWRRWSPPNAVLPLTPRVPMARPSGRLSRPACRSGPSRRSAPRARTAPVAVRTPAGRQQGAAQRPVPLHRGLAPMGAWRSPANRPLAGELSQASRRVLSRLTKGRPARPVWTLPRAAPTLKPCLRRSPGPRRRWPAQPQAPPLGAPAARMVRPPVRGPRTTECRLRRPLAPRCRFSRRGLSAPPRGTKGRQRELPSPRRDTPRGSRLRAAAP